MNCRPGDLAVIIESGHHNNIGQLVEVLRPGDLYVDGWVTKTLGHVMGRWPSGEWAPVAPGSNFHIADRHLRPLRDSDGPDETLTWAGLPSPQRIAVPT